MKKVIFFFITGCLFLFACQQTSDSDFLEEVKLFQQEMNTQYGDSLHSPLLPEDLAHFDGLDFYRPDKKFHVEARFVRTPDESPFEMKTTTDRLPVYVKYGEVFFEIDGEKFKLNIYQNVELTKKEAYKDYLFLPYTDLTSGYESYGGGRYIDLRIPEDETIIIDFNKSYNPYCAYNHKYSCPVPPRENFLDIEIRAGVKAFH